MFYKDKEKQREYQRKWRAKRRSDYFKDKSCVKCSSKENLELDHIDPTKKITNNIWSWSEERRLEEIAKCQVLCEKCHKIKTFNDMMVKHHGLTMYESHGCRCEVCRKAKSVKNAKRKRK